MTIKSDFEINHFIQKYTLKGAAPIAVRASRVRANLGSRDRTIDRAEVFRARARLPHAPNRPETGYNERRNCPRTGSGPA